MTRPVKEIKYSPEELATICELQEVSKRYTPRSAWTPFQIDLLKQFYGKVPVAVLAQKCGHGDKATIARAHKLGLTKGVELRPVKK